MKRILLPIVAGLLATPLLLAAADKAAAPDRNAMAYEAMLKSFKPKGQADMDRLKQDETQAACSLAAPGNPPPDMTRAIMQRNQAAIVYPSDGQYLGDWKQGEKIAQDGFGKQYSDDPAKPSGGNCYACHQLAAKEVAYGTIGPSLHHFGKLRGNSDDIVKYAYDKIYNSNAFSACTNMPRFGLHNWLTPEQITHIVAFLIDPESPVNKD